MGRSVQPSPEAPGPHATWSAGLRSRVLIDRRSHRKAMLCSLSGGAVLIRSKLAAMD
ncbi:MAG: hypothetical protein KDJ29_12485 [Hyphomicrobiales bacterium]|nr:hypothetical protein [Hyphomicrobiales bacterium]